MQVRVRNLQSKVATNSARKQSRNVFLSMFYLFIILFYFINTGDEHISFTTSKIGSLVDVNQSRDPDGLRYTITYSSVSLAVLRIRGSVPMTNGSGSDYGSGSCYIRQ